MTRRRHFVQHLLYVLPELNDDSRVYGTCYQDTTSMKIQNEREFTGIINDVLCQIGIDVRLLTLTEVVLISA